jgi:hypothetical protein
VSVATRRALYGKLAGDTTLTNLLHAPPTGYSKSIFYEVAPEGALFPYVIFQKQAGTPRYAMQTNAGTAAFDNEVWTIKGVDEGNTADTADAISSRLSDLLTDGTITISGRTQLYLRRESDIDYAEVRDGVTYRHSGSLYRLIYT